MNNCEYLIPEDTSKLLFEDLNNKYQRVKEDSFFFAINRHNCINFIQGDLNNNTENIFHFMQLSIEKEAIYIKAIENLLKQKEYLNLIYQLSNNLISDDEFNIELEENEDKYLIREDLEINYNHRFLLNEILNKIKYSFTEDDLSEIFSIDTNCLSNFIFSNNNNVNHEINL